MKNGFFHNNPTDYDIYVDEALQGAIGCDHINSHVENTRNSEGRVIADVTVNGKTYTAVSETHGADHYWKIVR